MSNLFALLRDVASGGVTVARAAIHLGCVTIQVAVRIIFAR